MSKQIYIDSDGNEIQVSGTVNSADMMPMSASDSTKVSEAIGDLSQLTTSDNDSLVDAVNEVDAKADSFLFADSTVNNFITFFNSIPNNKTVGFIINSNTVSNCPIPYPIGVIAKQNNNTAFIVLTQLNGTDASYIGRIISGVLYWRKITTAA